MQLRYSEEFKEQALIKVLQRGDKNIQMIADELNISVYTLKGCLRQSRSTTTMTDKMKHHSPKDWTQEQRFEALISSAGFEGETLSAFCRERGLFTHRLEARLYQTADSHPADPRFSSSRQSSPCKMKL